MTDLFSPLRLGAIELPNRIVMSSLTRTRAALVDYAELLKAHSVSRVRMVATSATLLSVFSSNLRYQSCSARS